MFKTHRSCPFKIGGKNWLKHNIKTVLIALKKKKHKDVVKLNILLYLDAIAIKILSPNISMNEIFS